MATIMSTPPPPSSRIRTPRGPRHGAFADNYQPYSPRKSSRIASRRARLAQTPPPQALPKASKQHHLSPPTTVKKPAQAGSVGTIPPTPQTVSKKSARSASSKQKVSGALTTDSTSKAAHALGFPPAPQTTMAALPTPAKTPKKAAAAPSSSLKAVARNIFPSSRLENIDVLMPVPRRSTRKSAFALDSEEEEPPIMPFTDMRERRPEIDNSLANPFYGRGALPPASPETQSKARASAARYAGRDDGALFTFRGKRMFRTHDQLDKERGMQGTPSVGDRMMGGEFVTQELLDLLPAHLRVPLSSRDIKPRRLFQKEIAAKLLAEEEAMTDVDDEMVLDSSSPIHHAYEAGGGAATPKAHQSTPDTSPMTTRATRRQSLQEVAGAGIERPTSPFDEWKRAKRTEAGDPSKKRPGDELTRSGPAGSKRLRRRATGV